MPLSLIQRRSLRSFIVRELYLSSDRLSRTLFDFRNLAMSASASLTQMLRWAYWWNSTEELPDHVTNEDVVMELNTDFSMQGMSAQEVKAVVGAWQSGAISRDTMLHLFRKGEILPEGRTTEEEEGLIEGDRPVVGAGAPK